MENPQYLLSIVVPTKNRYKYLKYLIELIENFHSDEIELVVQDNTYDNSEIREFLRKRNFHSLKYYHHKEPLSVSENCSLAVDAASGKYICFIGDDDGIVRNIVEVVKFMNDNNVEALISKIVEYNWPDYVDTSRYRMSGVVFSSVFCKKSGFVNVEKNLHRVCKDGFGNISGLPRLYQGIVKRDCLERVKEEFGNYFPGPSPDMANAIALSFVVKRLFYYDTPVIITGQCRSVGGGEKLMNGNLKYIGEIPFLPKDIETTWDKRLPPLWCSDTIWPQSAIEVLNKKHIKWKINYERIYARFVFHHPQYNKCINNKFINRCVFEGNLFYFRIADYFRYTKVRLQSLFSNNLLVNDNMVKRDIEDIQEAESFIYQNWCC